MKELGLRDRDRDQRSEIREECGRAAGVSRLVFINITII